MIKEVKSKETVNFVDLITVTIRTDKSEHRVAGTLFGKTEGRIVEIDDFRVDIDPVGWLLLIAFEDFPGIVGKVGTVLGENTINITGMQIVRTEGAENCVMMVGIETDIDTGVLNKLKEFSWSKGVKKIHFDIE